MPFTDILDSQDPKPVTSVRVVLISALVALVVGCVPALLSAVVIAGDFNEQASARSVENCESQRAQLKTTNDRVVVNRLSIQADIGNLKGDIALLRASAAANKDQPGATVILQASIDSKRKAIAAKKKALDKSVPYELPNCENLGDGG